MSGGGWYRFLTAPGQGGVQVLGLGGPALEGLDRDHLRDRRGRGQGLELAGLIDGDDLIDQVLVRRLPDHVEISLHGGPAIEARVRRLFAALGFVERPDWSPLRGIRRQARAALERARTRRELIFFARLAEGALDLRLREIADGLAGSETGEQVRRLREEMHSLVDRAPYGLALSRPPVVCIRGPANAGKSSLFNRLIGSDRVIVSARPGTTRDAVEGFAEIEGFPFRLVDLAGERATEDPVELLGQVEGRRRTDGADLVLDLRPASERDPEDPSDPDRRVIGVASKLDLTDRVQAARLATAASAPIGLSLETGAGLEVLRRRLVARSPFGAVSGEDQPGPFRPEQVDAIRAAERLALTEPALAAARLRALCDDDPG